MAALGDVWSKIKGIVGNFFYFDGGDGPLIKNNSGVVEFRNNADAAYNIVRGATPVAANDLATKAYVDGAESGEINVIEIPITFANAGSTVSSTFAGAVGGRVIEAGVIVDTAFDVGVTFKLGDSGDDDRFIVSGDVKLDKSRYFTFPQYTNTIAAVFDAVLGAGAPTVGAARVVIKYVSPLP